MDLGVLRLLESLRAYQDVTGNQVSLYQAGSSEMFGSANMAMGLHLIEACRTEAIEKVLVLGTVCAYPKFCPMPFKEDDIWNGYPEETNAPCGVAKKSLLVQLQAYRQEYCTRGIFLIPVNL